MEKRENNLGIMKSVILSIAIYILFIYAMCSFFKTDTSDFKEVREKVKTTLTHQNGDVEHFTVSDSYTINEGDRYIFSFVPGAENKVKDGALVFFLYNSIINVYCDDELIYSQDDDVPEGKMLGDLRYAVLLPEDYQDKEIRIEGVMMNDSPFTHPASIRIVPFDKINLVSLANNEMTYYCFLTLIFVSLLLVIFFTLLSIQDHKIQPGIWAAYETGVMCCWYLGYKTQFYVSSDWLAFNAVIEYIAIYLICTPLSFYMRSQFSRKLLKDISLVLGFINVIFFTVATVLNFSSLNVDYCDLLVYSHILSAVSFLFFLVALFIDDNKEKNYDYKVLKYGVCLALLIGVVFLISFNVSGKVQSILKLNEINYVPLAIMTMIIAMYINVFTSYAQETITTIEAARLSKLAYVDSLTGLPNRYALYEAFQDMHEDKIVDYVMVFMDVNDLKKTNDVQGHEKGDELLSDISEAIVSTFPNDNKNGIVGRWGGDEFIACIFGAENKADEFIEEFKRKIAETSHTVSIGKAVSTAKEPKDPSVAVAESDSAMYIDKALFHHRNRRLKK